MRKYLAVVSLQPGYAERLCYALENKDGCTLTPVPFSEPENMVAFCRNHSVGVILADEKISESGALAGIPGSVSILCLAESRDGGEHHLFRYSSVEEILCRISLNCGLPQISGTAKQGGRNVQLICVYSPALPSVKTAFALTLAAIRKRECRTLYLNLEEFGGVSTLLKSRDSKSLSDAVYYLKQENIDSQKLMSAICRTGCIDYIPPMPFADDMKEAGGEEWVKLIGKIAELTDYEEIIADLPPSLFVSQDLVDACDILYVPIGGDAIADARLKELEEYMQRTEHRGMREKVRKIQLSEALLPAIGSGDYVEEMMYGKFGEELMKEIDREYE